MAKLPSRITASASSRQAHVIHRRSAVTAASAEQLNRPRYYTAPQSSSSQQYPDASASSTASSETITDVPHVRSRSRSSSDVDLRSHAVEAGCSTIENRGTCSNEVSLFGRWDDLYDPESSVIAAVQQSNASTSTTLVRYPGPSTGAAAAMSVEATTNSSGFNLYPLPSTSSSSSSAVSQLVENHRILTAAYLLTAHDLLLARRTQRPRPVMSRARQRPARVSSLITPVRALAVPIWQRPSQHALSQPATAPSGSRPASTLSNVYWADPTKTATGERAAFISSPATTSKSTHKMSRRNSLASREAESDTSNISRPLGLASTDFESIAGGSDSGVASFLASESLTSAFDRISLGSAPFAADFFTASEASSFRADFLDAVSLEARSWAGAAEAGLGGSQYGSLGNTGGLGGGKSLSGSFASTSEGSSSPFGNTPGRSHPDTSWRDERSSPTSNAQQSSILNNQTQQANESHSTAFPFPPSHDDPERHVVHSIDPPAPPEAPRSYPSRPQSTDPSLLVYELYHGAYGIPKRPPVNPSTSASGSSRKGADSPPRSRSMLAAAADFLTGPQTAPPPPRSHTASNKSRQWKKLDPEILRSVQVGEDAYFLRSDSIGVADGVGGWATRPGANPAMFSRLLMHFCSVELSRHDHLHEGRPSAEERARYLNVDPVEVMQRAWERCMRVSRREGILGSSTALLALLRGKYLRIANLGDCVLIIIRRGEMIFRTQEQQHSFNFPLQLGLMIKRGSRNIEEILSKSATAASTEEAEKEDYAAVEAEADIAEHARRLDRASAEALGISEDIEAKRRADERAAAIKRAEEEGKSLEEMEAELEAAKEFDFDALNPGRSSGSVGLYGNLSHSNQHDHNDDNDDDGGHSNRYVDFDGDRWWDEPRYDCGRYSIPMKKGDIIILASDGLVDNLFDDDILEEVCRFAPAPSGAQNPHSESHHDDSGILLDSEHDGQSHSKVNSHPSSSPDSHSESGTSAYPPSSFSPQLLSEALCSRAKAISQDSKAIISPFQQKATEEGLHYVGGKHDDISVLVAVVGEAGEAEGEGKEGSEGEMLRFQGGGSSRK